MLDYQEPRSMPLTLAELQGMRLWRLDWRNLFTITADQGDGVTPEESMALDTYFARFLPPSFRYQCIACDRVLTGFCGSFSWGIQHGEGFCGCGYPGRGKHYDVGPIRAVDYVLQYHPSDLLTRDSARTEG